MRIIFFLGLADTNYICHFDSVVFAVRRLRYTITRNLKIFLDACCFLQRVLSIVLSVIMFGVAQGTVFGPILFLIFVKHH